MSSRKALDVRPVRLIYCGLWFGVNGTGFMLGVAASRWGRDAFTCIHPSRLDLCTISIRYLGWVYMVTLIGDLSYHLLDVLDKSSVLSTRRTIGQIGQLTWALVIFTALNFHPMGNFAFCPLVHCFVRLFVWGQQVSCILGNVLIQFISTVQSLFDQINANMLS